MSIVKVTLDATYYGQHCQNVIHFNNRDGAYTLEVCTQQIRDVWMPPFKAASQANCVWQQIKVGEVSANPPSPATLAISIAGSQSGTTTSLTFQAMLLRIRTGLPGPSKRGRIYVPGVNSTNASMGFWTTAIINIWATSIATIMSHFGPGGDNNLLLGVCDGHDPTTFNAVETLSLAPICAIQRRRNINVGI